MSVFGASILGLVMLFCGFLMGFTTAALLSMAKQADKDSEE